MNDVDCIQIVSPEIVEISKTNFTKLDGQATLKILYGGICGSDLNAYKGSNPYVNYPVIPGHEFSAEIVDIPENDYGFKKGMIVTAVPYFNCGTCYSCKRGYVNCCTNNQTMGVQRDGAFAKYISMPIERLVDGKNIDPRELALIEPFCIGYHAVKNANVKKGNKVLVIGAGAIGVFAGISAKLMGAEVYLSDISEEKLKIAKEFGFEGTILNDTPENFSKKVSELTENNGFDITIEAVGLSSTFQNAIDSVAFRGTVVLIGVSKQTLEFDFTVIQKKELEVVGSRNALKEEFLELVEIVSKGLVDIKPIITKEYKFDDAKEAFEYLKNNLQNTLKIILEF